MREMRETEKAQARAEAADSHVAHEERLNEFRTVLANRTREVYSWEKTWASHGEFVFEPFREPKPAFTRESILVASKAQYPIARWLIPTIFLLAITLMLGDTIFKLAAAAVGVLLIVWIRRVLTTRRTKSEQLLLSLTESFERDVVELRATHDSTENAHLKKWREDEKYRANVRSADERDDLETLTAVLEEELANENLPVPLVFELELNDDNTAQIEITLPEIEEIPEERTQLTKTGKLSSRKMAQRDRVELYEDLCCGLALRLAYETFRVLRRITTVEVFGTSPGIDPATGANIDFVALHVKTERGSLTQVNLDAADPSSAVELLGGEFACDRRGNLKAISGLSGLLRV